MFPATFRRTSHSTYRYRVKNKDKNFVYDKEQVEASKQQ